MFIPSTNGRGLCDHRCVSRASSDWSRWFPSLSARKRPNWKILTFEVGGCCKVFHNVPFPPPTSQTAKYFCFTVSCIACNKPRHLHSKTVVKGIYQKPTKRLVEKLDIVCGSVLSEYEGTGNEKDRKLLNNIHVRENISCSSKIELPYYSVDHFPKICIYCGVRGTSRSLGSSPETYPKCESCKGKPDVQKRKRKAVLHSDLLKKKKKWGRTTYQCCLHIF